MNSGTPIAEPVPMSAAPADDSCDQVRRAMPAALSAAGVRRRRAIAAVIAVGWCITLACLALATSNPVTLNRKQILSADTVVTAQIVDRAAGSCRVVRQWRGSSTPVEIAVLDLAQTAAGADGEWILPLLETEGGYLVAPTALPTGTRLVYPATEDAVRQMEGLTR